MDPVNLTVSVLVASQIVVVPTKLMVAVGIGLTVMDKVPVPAPAQTFELEMPLVYNDVPNVFAGALMVAVNDGATLVIGVCATFGPPFTEME